MRSADYHFERGAGDTQPMTVDPSADFVCFRGSMLSAKADGFAGRSENEANDKAFGVSLASYDIKSVANGGPPAGDPRRRIAVWRGLARIPHAGAVQTDVGANVYAVDDDTLADTATNAATMRALPVLDWEAGHLWIDFRAPAW